MRHSTIISTLQNLTNRKVTQQEIANILNLSINTIGGRARRNSKYSNSEITQLNKFFNVDLMQCTNGTNCTNSTNIVQGKISTKQELNSSYQHLCSANCIECNKRDLCKKIKRKSEPIELFYVDNLPDAWKHPKLTTFNFDDEATKIMMHDKENIRVVIMPHDKMNGGSYPLKTRDILFIDISERDISRAGCYLFTSRNNTYYFLCNINITIEGNVRFSYSNPANASEEKIKSFAELEKLDFRVIGRMFKNATLTV